MWILLAGIAAISFGIRGILYQWASRKPLNPNLLVFGVYSSGAILSAALILTNEIAWDNTAWVGSAMGLFSVIGNLAMLRGFAVGKASLVALLTGLPSLIVVSGAYFIWNEQLSVVQMCSFALIVAGIITIRYSKDLTTGSMKGFGWGLLAMAVFGLHDISGQFAMKHDAPQMWSLFMLFVTGALLVGVRSIGARWRGQEISVVHKQWSIRRTFATGLMIGMFHMSGTFFLMRAFDLGITGLVSAVVSINVVLIITYAGVFLKERFAMKEWVGMIAALVGVVLLSIF